MFYDMQIMILYFTYKYLQASFIAPLVMSYVGIYFVSIVLSVSVFHS